MKAMTLSSHNIEPEALQGESEWQLGDWLPITWKPATKEEIEYMDLVRERVAKEHDNYIKYLQWKLSQKTYAKESITQTLF